MKGILYTVAAIATLSALIFLYVQYNSWRFNQKYEDTVTIRCRHQFIDCANENRDFIVSGVSHPSYHFLVGQYASLRWDDHHIPYLDSLYENDILFKHELEVTGTVYKNLFDVSVSSMDCEVNAYRIDVKHIKVLDTQ